MTTSPGRNGVPLLLFLAAIGDAAHAQDRAKPAAPSIPALIRALGSERYAEREKAHKAPLALDEAMPELLRTMPSLNAEAQSRSRAILDAFVQRRTARFLKYGREGRVDLFLEWSALFGTKIDPAEYWQCVLDASWRLWERSQPLEASSAVIEQLPARTYKKLLSQRTTFINGDKVEHAGRPVRLAIRSDSELKGGDLYLCIGVATGTIELKGTCSGNVIITLGDFKSRDAYHSVIIADGDVIIDIAPKCVIAARGKTAVAMGSGSRSDDLPEGHLLLLPERRWRPPTGVESTIVQDGIQFFETNDVGLELTNSDERTRVVAVERDSRLAKAGLAKGDVLVAIDGVAIKDADTARRLRRAFVLGGAEITVERAGKPLTLGVSFIGVELPSNEGEAK